MSNIQCTYSVSPNNARSESCISINPNNPLQMVAASKKWRDLYNYDFTLATVYSKDGGHTWQPSADLALLPATTLLTDPALAWDDVGNVFLVGLAGSNPPTVTSVGIVIYTSTDGGQTWSVPNPIHYSGGDDKQWMAGDGNPASPFHGRVYAVWDDGIYMRFARTLDHGATWIGAGSGTPPVGTILTNDSFSPEINVAADGTIYIVWLNGIAGNQIKMLVSMDGGATFHATPQAASGITTLQSSLARIHAWPVLPGGTFRVDTVPTACVAGQTVVVA
jgi:BNR/Asp-box repeat protein